MIIVADLVSLIIVYMFPRSKKVIHQINKYMDRITVELSIGTIVRFEVGHANSQIP